jgi:hypothetical protein
MRFRGVSTNLACHLATWNFIGSSESRLGCGEVDIEPPRGEKA